MYHFTPNLTDATLGDALEIADLAGVGDFTLCAYFTRDAISPFNVCLTAFLDAVIGNYAFYYSDFTHGAFAVAEGAIAYSDIVDATLSPTSLGAVHSLVIRRTGGTTMSWWVDGVSVFSGTVTAGTFTAKNLRIGCIFQSGANTAFARGNIGQWAFFTRAWSDPEIATYHAGRTSAINRNSEALWGLLSFDDTDLADYRPLFDDVLDHSGNGRAAATVVGAPVAAISRLRSATIAPGGGDMLYLEMERASDSADTTLASYNGGLTITAPGGDPIDLPLTQCATRFDFLWSPIDQNVELILADTAATLTGTWTTGGGTDNGKYGLHNSGDLNRFTRALGSSLAETAVASDSAVYTFTDVPPGKYVVPIVYHAFPDRTTLATYVVKDGVTTVGTFTIDQTVTMRYDVACSSRRARLLGPDPKLTAPLYTANEVTITTGATVTVTITNTAGSGVLTCNLVALRRIIQPFPSGAVLNAPAGWCTTAAGDAEPLVAVAVDPADVDTFIPFDPDAVRTMRVGYGVDYPRYNRPSLFYADRFRAANQGWSGTDFTTDSDQNLTAMGGSGNATRLWMQEPVGIHSSFDGAVLATMKESGTWTVKYTIVTGDPVVTIELETDHGEVLGTPTTPTLVGGKMVFTISIDTRGTIHPGAANLLVRVTGGAAKVEIYGPEVPSDWDSLYHPSLISWLANRGFDVIRANALALSFDESAIDWTDAPSETASSTFVASTTRTFAVTTAGAADPADTAPWFGAINQRVAAKVTTAAAHGMRTGDFFRMDGLSDGGIGWGVTTAGGTAGGNIFGDVWGFCVRVDDTHFLWLGGGTDNGEVNNIDPTRVITLTGSHSTTGTITVYTGQYPPVVHLVGLVNECNIRTYHVNPPMSATNTYITTLADRIAATLDLDKQVRLGSPGNECWNSGFPTKVIAGIWEHHTQWLWDDSGGTLGAPVGSAQGYAWLAWRLDQMATIFRARFVAAGRPGTDVISVLEAQLNATVYTSYATDAAISLGLTPFDELAVATYRDMFAFNDPTGGATGYVTDIAAGLAALSDASAVSLVWLGQSRDATVDALLTHRAVLQSHAGFETKPIITYEGGDQNIGYATAIRGAAIYRNRLFRRKELAMLQRLQDAGGLATENKYLLCYPDGPVHDFAQWLDYWTSFEDAGTGDPAEGQNPHDMRSGEGTATFGPAAPSQAGGARREWASYFTDPDAGAALALTTTVTVTMYFLAQGDDSMQLTAALRTSRAQEIKDALGSGGSLVIYTGAPPGVGNSVGLATLLATLTNLTFGTPAAGAVTFTATADTNAAATGTPGFGRMLTSGGAAKVEFACAVGSGEANFDHTITSGGTVTLSSGAVTEGNA